MAGWQRRRMASARISVLQESRALCLSGTAERMSLYGVNDPPGQVSSRSHKVSALARDEQGSDLVLFDR